MVHEDIAGWLRGRLPDEWYAEDPDVTVDREEILVVGRLAAPAEAEGDPPAAEGDPPAAEGDPRAAEQGRIARFREDTRDQRIRIAREAQRRFEKSVAWGAQCGETRQVFTTVSVPVMTRLRQPERLVLDTLVEAGVARSRADALAWCVRLVGRHTDDWLGQLRDALGEVHRVRSAGPDAA